MNWAQFVVLWLHVGLGVLWSGASKLPAEEIWVARLAGVRR